MVMFVTGLPSKTTSIAAPVESRYLSSDALVMLLKDIPQNPGGIINDDSPVSKVKSASSTNSVIAEIPVPLT